MMGDNYVINVMISVMTTSHWKHVHPRRYMQKLGPGILETLETMDTENIRDTVNTKNSGTTGNSYHRHCMKQWKYQGYWKHQENRRLRCWN